MADYVERWNRCRHFALERARPERAALTTEVNRVRRLREGLATDFCEPHNREERLIVKANFGEM